MDAKMKAIIKLRSPFISRRKQAWDETFKIVADLATGKPERWIYTEGIERLTELQEIITRTLADERKI